MLYRRYFQTERAKLQERGTLHKFEFKYFSIKIILKNQYNQNFISFNVIPKLPETYCNINIKLLKAPALQTTSLLEYSEILRINSKQMRRMRSK